MTAAAGYIQFWPGNSVPSRLMISCRILPHLPRGDFPMTRTLASAALLFLLTFCPASFAAQPKAAGGDWPQWRGPQRDGLSTEKGLLSSWPEKGPPLLWQVKGLGSGYAS